MTKLAPKLEQLKEAFSWEREQLRDWQNKTKENFGPGEQNEIKQLLNTAWYLYLGELQNSNTKVITICEQLSNDDITKEKAIYWIKTAIDENMECTDVRQAIDDYLDSI